LNESGSDGEPVTGWLTSRDWLVQRLHRGDRIWLFIGGDACGDAEGSHRAYVAQLLIVDGWGPFENYKPDVQGSPKYRINAIQNRCVLVNPPVLVDSIFRQPGNSPEMHIGTARQNPFELDNGQMTQLLTLLRDQYSGVYEIATQA
jgi:hypothetical protein